MSSRNLFLVWMASMALFGALMTYLEFGDVQGISPIRERALGYLLLIDVFIGAVSFLWLYIRWCVRYPLVIYGSILLFIIAVASWSYASAVQRKEGMAADSEFHPDGEVVLSPERLDTPLQSDSSIERASDPDPSEPSKPSVASTPSPQPVAAKAQPTEEKKKKKKKYYSDSDKELKEITESLNKPIKTTSTSSLPKLQKVSIPTPSPVKTSNLNAEVKTVTTDSGTKLNGSECGGSAGKYLPYCP